MHVSNSPENIQNKDSKNYVTPLMIYANDENRGIVNIYYVESYKKYNASDI